MRARSHARSNKTTTRFYRALWPRFFQVVRMRRCRDAGPGVPTGEAFKICPFWIPPSTFTAIAIPPNSTCVRYYST